MTSFECLPFDVIDYILNCDCLSYIDVCRLSSVSKILNCIAKSNKLWKKKYSQLWPEFVDLYDAHNTDWQYECRTRSDFKKLIVKKLLEMSVEYYHYESLSNEVFFYFKDISRNHPLGCEIIIDELENIIYHPDRHLSLTRKYYAKRTLRYMRHIHLKMRWEKYLSGPGDELSLVKGACLISEWCQPTVAKCTSNVKIQIESIAKLILEKIKELFPKHPVLKQELLNDDNIPHSFWSHQQCKDILYCASLVIFHDLKFVATDLDCCSSNASLIDRVLTERIGMRITLGIIYAAIVSKLGVCCVLIDVNFLLKCVQNPKLDEKCMYTFVDIMDDGAIKTPDNVLQLPRGPTMLNLSKEVDGLPPLQVLVKWAWYLVEFGRQRDGRGEDTLALSNALELICLLSPSDMEHKLLLARLFMHLKINVTEGISLLQEIAAAKPSSPLTLGFMYQSTLQTLETQRISRPIVKVKLQHRDKSKNVKYAVGMIMRHLKYDFRCVIYGWDETCSASKDWINRMGVNTLTYKDTQPFYYILVTDGTNRYCAEENLQIDLEHKPLPHIKVGKYFESFHGNYYLPNEQTLAEYPDDIAAREAALNIVKNEQ